MRDSDAGPPVLRLRIARGFFARLLGVYVAPFGAGHDGLMIAPCRAIHTFGLVAPIDVVFLDRQRTVIRCMHSLPPNRWAGAWRARIVVELPGGYCARHLDWAQRLARARIDGPVWSGRGVRDRRR